VANAIKVRNNADNLFIGRIKKFVIATAKVVIFSKKAKRKKFKSSRVQRV
jgi:hypothetical protein